MSGTQKPGPLFPGFFHNRNSESWNPKVIVRSHFPHTVFPSEPVLARDAVALAHVHGETQYEEDGVDLDAPCRHGHDQRRASGLCILYAKRYDACTYGFVTITEVCNPYDAPFSTSCRSSERSLIDSHSWQTGINRVASTRQMNKVRYPRVQQYREEF